MKQVLWTIQHEDAFAEFEKTGLLQANESYLFCEDEFRFAYDWMAEQMSHRIGEPPVGVRYPIWAWYQWEGKRKRRDLRCGGYGKRDTPLVQITFEADEADFVLSDFDDWHFILSHHYIADTEAEWDAFLENNGMNRTEEIVKSWDKVFDISRHSPGWDHPPERKSIQATLWQISMSQVIKVEHFIAK